MIIKPFRPLDDDEDSALFKNVNSNLSNISYSFYVRSSDGGFNKDVTPGIEYFDAVLEVEVIGKVASKADTYLREKYYLTGMLNYNEHPNAYFESTIEDKIKLAGWYLNYASSWGINLCSVVDTLIGNRTLNFYKSSSNSISIVHLAELYSENLEYVKSVMKDTKRLLEWHKDSPIYTDEQRLGIIDRDLKLLYEFISASFNIDILKKVENDKYSTITPNKINEFFKEINDDAKRCKCGSFSDIYNTHISREQVPYGGAAYDITSFSSPKIHPIPTKIYQYIKKEMYYPEICSDRVVYDGKEIANLPNLKINEIDDLKISTSQDERNAEIRRKIMEMDADPSNIQGFISHNNYMIEIVLKTIANNIAHAMFKISEMCMFKSVIAVANTLGECGIKKVISPLSCDDSDEVYKESVYLAISSGCNTYAIELKHVLLKEVTYNYKELGGFAEVRATVESNPFSTTVKVTAFLEGGGNITSSSTVDKSALLSDYIISGFKSEGIRMDVKDQIYLPKKSMLGGH